MLGGLLRATGWNAIHETLGRSNGLSLEAPELLHGSFLFVRIGGDADAGESERKDPESDSFIVIGFVMRVGLTQTNKEFNVDLGKTFHRWQKFIGYVACKSWMSSAYALPRRDHRELSLAPLPLVRSDDGSGRVPRGEI